MNDDYETQILGDLHPPETGLCSFAINSDDEGVLFLSTDTSPANKVAIAWEAHWNNPRTFGCWRESTSAEDGVVQIRASHFEAITGFQFSLVWDPDLWAFDGVDQLNLKGLSMADFGIARIQDGQLAVVWLDSGLQHVSLPQDLTLFSIAFRSLSTATEPVIRLAHSAGRNLAVRSDRPIAVRLDSQGNRSRSETRLFDGGLASRKGKQ